MAILANTLKIVNPHTNNLVWGLSLTLRINYVRLGVVFVLTRGET